MQEIWQQIEEYLKVHVPTVIETLNPPATKTEIQQLEKGLGHSVPADFKNYLLVHNGQNDPSRLQTLCEEGTLLSTEAIIDTYKMLNEINEGNEIAGPEWWSRKYMPIADSEGDYLSIDLESGELVMHIHDSGIEKGIASSFLDWFHTKLSIFRESKFSVDEGYLDYWKYDS